MADVFDWKKYQFITEVQTAVICNAIRKKGTDECHGNESFFSAMGVSSIMEEAFFASEKLPQGQSAHESAVQFIDFHVLENRHPEATWFQRG